VTASRIGPDAGVQPRVLLVADSMRAKAEAASGVPTKVSITAHSQAS
jgi:hypothetical protein